MAKAPASDRAVDQKSNEVADYAAPVVKRLTNDFAELANSVTLQLDEARLLPKTIESDDQLTAFAALIKRMRDTTKRIESHHAAEKEPYLRGGQGVDQFFFGLWEKIAKRTKTSNNGAIDILDARVDDYMNRKRIEEENRRREEAAKQEAIRLAAEKLAREAQAWADEIRRRADEAAAAAERARKQENIDKHAATAAAQAAEADRLALEAAAAASEAYLAAEKADDARIDTLATPADMTRTRLDGGITATMKQEPFVEIIDATLLNKELLWPHIKEEHLLMALKAYGKATSHKRPMAGAIIEMRHRGLVR